MTRRSSLALLCLTAALLSDATAASAGGLELSPGGARALGRGGAVAAQPSDAMALLHNPAGLSLLASDQFLLEFDTTIHTMCVDPYGYYGWGVYDLGGTSEFGESTSAEYGGRALPEVCNSVPVLPVPEIAWALRLNDDIVIGFGMVSPTFVPGLQFGGDDGTIVRDGVTLPTPTRYQMIRQEVVFGLNPTAGIGYRVLPWLAVGATLHVGMVKANTYAIQNTGAGTAPHTDAMAELSVSDYFIPAASLSVHAKPTDAIDLVAAFRLADDVRASGDLTYTTRYFLRGNTGEGQVPFENDPVTLANVEVPLPWALTVGMRYADLLGPNEDTARGRLDPIENERWDIELDAVWNFNERASVNTVEVGGDVNLVFRNADGTPQTGIPVDEDELQEFTIDRHLEDSLAVRLGGSYTLLPGTLQLHAGTFWENRGVDPDYASIDSFAFRRVGFGVGVSVRLGDYDLRAAYGHIFQENLEIAPPPHEDRRDENGDATGGFDQRVAGEVLEDPDAPSIADADAVARLEQRALAETEFRPQRVINAGRYEADFHIVSVGLTYRF